MQANSQPVKTITLDSNSEVQDFHIDGFAESYGVYVNTLKRFSLKHKLNVSVMGLGFLIAVVGLAISLLGPATPRLMSWDGPALYWYVLNYPGQLSMFGFAVVGLGAWLMKNLYPSPMAYLRECYLFVDENGDELSSDIDIRHCAGEQFQAFKRECASAE